MGDVYQHARLTIAASHASDSSQPCFFPRPPLQPSVELEAHINANGDTEHGIFATLLPTDYTAISPEFGPLASRAWATQEWLLSRRMIFYTSGNIVWSCKTITQRETGASFHDTARNPRWKNIVEKYSSRALTLQTDRLIALDGLREEIAKKRGNDTYYLGLWRNGMPDHLLWYCTQPGERSKCPLSLPTWTWASTLHRVRFLDLDGAKNACKAFHFDDKSHVLSIRGVVKSVSCLIPHEDVATSEQSVFYKAPRSIVAPGFLYAIRDEGGGVGWCVLDDDGECPSTDIRCLRLMSKTVKTRIESRAEKMYSDFVMLLRGSEDAIYKRIGVGCVSSSTGRWFDGAEEGSVRIR